MHMPSSLQMKGSIVKLLRSQPGRSQVPLVEVGALQSKAVANNGRVTARIAAKVTAGTQECRKTVMVQKADIVLSHPTPKNALVNGRAGTLMAIIA